MKIQPSITVFAFLTLALSLISCNHNARSFYIDPVNGDDNNSGKRHDRAWKTLDRISRNEFIPGDSILLRTGHPFEGRIILAGLNGSAEKPIVISSCGSGKAIINSGDSAAIIINNSSHIHCHNLKITGSGRLTGSQSDGLLFNETRQVFIDSIDASGYLFSGVHVKGGSDIRITRVYAHDNGFAGIFAESGEEKYGEDGSEFKTLRNIYIGYSVAENNPGCPVITNNHSGNGILIAGVVHGTIEYCEAMENGWDMPREGNGPVGIWAYMSDSIVIRYCYSHHNKTSEKGKDGGGFDFDGGIRYSVMENNLSAFNEGAGYGIFQYAGATEWTDNIIRNNISYNDGSKNSQSGIFMWCDPAALPMKNFSAVFNTVVTTFNHAVAFEPGTYENFVFSANIFQTGNDESSHLKKAKTASNEFITGNYSGAVFKKNLFWSNNPPESVKQDSEALIKDPGLLMPPGNMELKPADLETIAWFVPEDSNLKYGVRVEEP